MSWESTPSFDAAFRAAMTNGKNVIYVSLPTWWTVRPLLAELPPPTSPGTANVLLMPEAVGLLESAAFLETLEDFRTVHAVTGLTRTARLVRSTELRTLISTPADFLTLLSRSAIDTSTIERIALCWPELHVDQSSLDNIETILAECRDAQRVVLTSDPSAITEFLERHARRAPTAVHARPAEMPIGSARYAVTEFSRIAESVDAALNVLNPVKALIWDPSPDEMHTESQSQPRPGTIYCADPGLSTCDLAIAMELPTQDVLKQLQDNARDVLLLVRAFQVPFAKTMLETARPLRLPCEADRAHDRAYRLRQEIRDHIDRHSVSDGLLALSTLFDEYDAATVAAALASKISLPNVPADLSTEIPAWIRVRVDAGKRHRIRTGDLVGALLNAVELPKNCVGKVDVRDGYSLVEVRAEVADEAVAGLNSLQLRGNKLSARPDRH